MRISILVLTALIWASPASANRAVRLVAEEAVARLGQTIEGLQTARFAVYESPEVKMIMRRMSGKNLPQSPWGLKQALGDTNPGAMADLAADIEARLVKIDQRYKAEWRKGTFGQTLLRRIIREELTIASTRRGPLDRLFGTDNIQFVRPKTGGIAEIEEIFVNAAGKEIMRPEEVFENLALNVDSLRGLATGFGASSYDAEMWLNKMIHTFSDATAYLKQAGEIAVWEGHLGAKNYFTDLSATAREIRDLQETLRGHVANLRKTYPSLYTTEADQALKQTSLQLKDGSKLVDGGVPGNRP